MRIQSISTPNLHLPDIHDHYYYPSDPVRLPSYVLTAMPSSRAREVQIETVEDNYFQRYGLQPIAVSSMPLSEYEEAVLDELLPMREGMKIMRTLVGTNYPDFIEKSLQEYYWMQRRLKREDEEKVKKIGGYWGQFQQRLCPPI